MSNPQENNPQAPQVAMDVSEQVLVVGDRVQIARRVLGRDWVRSEHRRLGSNSWLAPVYLPDTAGRGRQILTYPHPWEHRMVGAWVSGMDSTLGLEGVVINTAGRRYQGMLQGEDHGVARAPARSDSDVQVSVELPDGSTRLWWYSRLAVEKIYESNPGSTQETQLTQEGNQAMTNQTAPALRDGLATPSPAAPRAVPELQEGRVIPVTRATRESTGITHVSIHSCTVPLGSGLATREAPAAAVPESAPPLVPLLRQGLAEARRSTGEEVQGARDQGEGGWTDGFRVGDTVLVVRAVYATHQEEDDEYDVPSGAPVDPRWGDAWVNEMNALIGRQLVVCELSRTRGVVVDDTSSGMTYGMSPMSLQLVSRGNQWEPPGEEQDIPLHVGSRLLDQSAPQLRQGLAQPSSGVVETLRPAAPELRPGSVSAAAVATATGAATAPEQQESLSAEGLMVMVIGGAYDEDSYHVLGLVPRSRFQGRLRNSQEALAGVYEGGELNASPYLRQLVLKCVGVSYGSGAPLGMAVTAETSRLYSMLPSLATVIVYDREDTPDDADDDDEVERDCQPRYWLSAIDLCVNGQGVVVSGSSIGGLEHRVYVR